MKQKSLFAAAGGIFLLSLLFFPLSAEAIPRLLVGPPDQLSPEGPFILDGPKLAICFGSNSGLSEEDKGKDIWLLTTSSSGGSFTFTFDGNGGQFGEPEFGEIKQYGEDYFGINLGSINENSGLWEPMDVEFAEGKNMEYYCLTGDIEAEGFGIGDWLFAYIPDLDLKSPQTTSTTVPEPSTVLLIGTGLIGLGILRRRLRKS